MQNSTTLLKKKRMLHNANASQPNSTSMTAYLSCTVHKKVAYIFQKVDMRVASMLQ